MGLTERVFDAFTKTILLSDKVEQLSARVGKQQLRIEKLNERIVRLETALEFALLNKRTKHLPGPHS
jgi:hypothetical protein